MIIANSKLIIFYLVIKALATTFMLQLLIHVFVLDIISYNDFNYYVNNPTGLGPNIGFRFIIHLFGINTAYDQVSILLALFFNTFIDIAWIMLLRKFLSFKQLLLFITFLAIQPYLATYTLRFSSIIFAKLAVLYFFYQMTNDINKDKSYHLKDTLFWIPVILMRNSNVFIFIPILIYRLRAEPIKMVFSITAVSAAVYYLSFGYLDGLNINKWPWSYNYVDTLFSTDNALILSFTFITARILLLFGAREKLFTEGIEPFLVQGLPLFELGIYILLGIIQIIGFYSAVRFFYRRYSYYSFLSYLPLLLALFSVSHARYIIPYLPLTFFGLALLLKKKNEE
jgi:hypothetical protein